MKIVRYCLVFVKLLCELHLSSRTVYVTHTNMAVTLAQFLPFFQSEGNWIKGVKIITSMGMLRTAAKQTELVGPVRGC